MKFDDTVNGGLAALFGIAVILASRELPSVQHIEYGPGFLPMLIGGGLILAGLTLVGRRLVLGEGKIAGYFALSRPISLARAALSVGIVVGAILVYILTIHKLGFLLTMPLTLMILLIYFDAKPGRDILIALVGSYVLHSFFYQVMSVQLPWGLLTPVAGTLTW